MNTLTNKQLVKLEGLKKLAIELDAACNSALIDTALIKHAQDRLNAVADSLIKDKTVGDKAYIVYEVQGLIHWLNGKYTEANSLIHNAYIINNETKLFTRTANTISSKATSGKSKNNTQSVSTVVGIVVLVLAACIVGSFGLAFIYFLTTLG